MVSQMYDRLRHYADFLEGKTRDGILRSYTPTTREENWMFIGDWARPTPTPDKGGFNMDSKEEREFFNNCYRNGIVPVELPIGTVRSIAAEVEASGGTAAVTVDVESQTVTAPPGAPYAFPRPATPNDSAIVIWMFSM